MDAPFERIRVRIQNAYESCLSNPGLRTVFVETRQFFLEPDNLKYWFLVSLAGYSTSLFLWAIDTHPPIVEKYFLENLAQSGLRRALTTHTVLVVLLFNIAWLLFSYLISRLNSERISASLKRDALTFSPCLVLLLPLILFPAKIDSIFFQFLFILVVGAVVAWKATLLEVRLSERAQRTLDLFCDRGVWVLVLLYAVTFSTLAILKHEALQSTWGDLGMYDQAVWHNSRGRISYLGQFVGTYDGSCIQPHVDPILTLIAPLYLVWPDVRVLLILQSVALALGAVPVYNLAKERLGSTLIALSFSASYLLFPALQYVNMFDFHDIALAIPLLLFAFYYLQRKAYKRYGLFLLLSLMCKEEVALTGIVVGVYIFYYQKERRIGLATLIVSLAWFVFSNWFVLHDIVSARQHYSALGHNTKEVIYTILFNPNYVLRDTLVARKIVHFLQLFAPTLFMAFFGQETLVLMVPALLTTMLATSEAASSIYFYYTAPLIPWIFVCSVYGVGTVLQVLEGINRKKALTSLSILLAVTGLLTNYHFSPSPLSKGFDSGNFAPTPHHKRLNTVKALIPPESSLFTTNRLAPHFTHRKSIHVMTLQAMEQKITLVTDYILLDLREEKHIDSPSATDYILPVIEGKEYGVVLFEDDFILLKKGHDTSQNEEVLDTISRNRTFQAEEMPGQVGALRVKDNAAENRRARYGNVMADEGGILSFGPYVSLPPGVYRVSFRLKVDANTSDEGVATIDIYSVDVDRVFASRTLTGRDFTLPNEYQAFALDFIAEEKRSYEFRIAFHDTADLWADVITVSPTSTPRVEFVYEAKAMPSQIGSVTEEGIRYAEAARDPPGFLAYGPYEPFLPGRYVAYFRVKVDNTTSEPVAALDVSNFDGEAYTFYAGEELKGTDFIDNRTFHEFALPFEIGRVDGAQTLEFRVWYAGIANLWFDRVVVRPVEIYDP